MKAQLMARLSEKLNEVLDTRTVTLRDIENIVSEFQRDSSKKIAEDLLDLKKPYRRSAETGTQKRPSMRGLWEVVSFWVRNFKNFIGMESCRNPLRTRELKIGDWRRNKNEPDTKRFMAIRAPVAIAFTGQDNRAKRNAS